MKQIKRYSYGTTPESVITQSCNEQCPDGYTMHLKSQTEWDSIVQAVNQGIDSHLEGFTRSTFDSNTGKCKVHPDELHILMRRLMENGTEEAESLRTDILSTLEIEEI